jgi:hypothetical protein
MILYFQYTVDCNEFSINDGITGRAELEASKTNPLARLLPARLRQDASTAYLQTSLPHIIPVLLGILADA